MKITIGAEQKREAKKSSDSKTFVQTLTELFGNPCKSLNTHTNRFFQ